MEFSLRSGGFVLAHVPVRPSGRLERLRLHVSRRLKLFQNTVHVRLSGNLEPVQEQLFQKYRVIWVWTTATTVSDAAPHTVRARCGGEKQECPRQHPRGVHFKIQISAVQSQPVLSNRPPRVRVWNREKGIFFHPGNRTDVPGYYDHGSTPYQDHESFMIGNNERQKGRAEVLANFGRLRSVIVL